MIDSAEKSVNDKDKKDTYTIREAAEQTAGLVDKSLKGAPELVREMTTHLSGARGKGVRTLLLFACSADDEGLVRGDAVTAAAAVELFHLATLVHDDIVDDADLRRGIPAIHKKFGYKEAVLCGDYLLCLAMSALTPMMESGYQNENAGLPAAFAKALAGICLGELDEHRNNRNLNLGIRRYLKIISGKTASLFYVSAYAGAILGNRNQTETKLLSRFGRNLGMVFQIVDDCKDYEFSEEKAQKPVCNDVSEGVVTLPLILSLQKEPELAKLALEAFDADSAAGLLHQKVIAAGGVEASRKLAEKYFRKSIKLLEKLESKQKREALTEILQKALGASVSF